MLTIQSVCKELPFLDNLDPELLNKIEKQLKICYKFTRDTIRTTDTPYTTAVHRDLWINNVMIKKGMRKEKNGFYIRNKVITTYIH